MIRLWFKDGTYMDVTAYEAQCYEMDPELDHSEDLDATEVEDSVNDVDCIQRNARKR